jgi:uncharacterized protein with PIN domain
MCCGQGSSVDSEKARLPGNRQRDRFAYALAKTTGDRLLFKGDHFSRMTIPVAYIVSLDEHPLI